MASAQGPESLMNEEEASVPVIAVPTTEDYASMSIIDRNVTLVHVLMQDRYREELDKGQINNNGGNSGN